MSQPNERDRIGAIILAAGSSRRMGRNKLLLPIDGRPMLTRVVATFHAARNSITPIVIVTGYEPQSVKAALGDEFSHVEFAHNSNHDAGGMLSSIKTGVTSMRGRADAFFLALVDQPWVREATLQQVIEAWRASRADVLRPTYQGKHGHPILLDARCIDSILSLPDDGTLNEFVRANPTKTFDVSVQDEATIQDIDTPADYEAAMKRRDPLSAD
ncbi:MAG: nucleotidyltransferase family protein [Anaerolineae bacterium]|nr:nucleotidyltransferase family protein [Phycisphaerae bacterium]